MIIMSASSRYFFSNWKMYLGAAESEALARALRLAARETPEGVRLAVFPSALALPGVASALAQSPIAAGAQNVYWTPEGGYTGEVSAEMYARAGARYALVGHSERRHQFHETNHQVRLKLEACLAAKLTPVLCVGDTYEERTEGATREVLEAQVRAAYMSLAWPADRELIIAYEPVWAISRGVGKEGLHCNAAEAERWHVLIRQWSKEFTGAIPRVLFGGSVRPETIKEYMESLAIDGVLVGAAATSEAGWKSLYQHLLS